MGQAIENILHLHTTMHFKFSLSLIVTLLSITANCDNSLSENLALFWNLYDSVVTGTRILHDVTEGVGAVSKAIKAIDSFLDNNAEDQLSETVKDAISEDTVAPKETLTVKPPTESNIQEIETCQASTKKDGSSCAKESTIKTEESVESKESTIPKFNGCGALGFHIKDSNLPVTKMTDCCGVHDACYGASCRSNKRDCDGKLRNCLFDVCNDKTVVRSSQKSCRAAGKLLFSGTMALSFQQYNDAQKLLKCSG